MGKLDIRMDEILDSISENGINNLSKEDKLFLKYESDGMDYQSIIYKIHIELNPKAEEERKISNDILNICFPTPEEEGTTEDEFLYRYKLSGKIYASLGENWTEGEYDFNLGPSTTRNKLSDAIFIDEYLKDICRKINISENTFDVGIAENVHMIYANSEDEAKKIIGLILKEIKADGFEIEYAKT